MRRLIDESELIEIIQGNEELLEFQKDECINCIKACDTAYDPDKVVEQLENDEKHTFDGCINKRYAIEIVKGGRVNEAVDV